MPETPFPSPEELQKKIQEFMKANFGDQVWGRAYTTGLNGRPAGGAPGTAFDPFEFNLTPKQIKAHLDRFVIQQAEAKKTCRSRSVTITTMST